MCQESLARSEVRENRASKPPTDAAANTRTAIATSTADSNSMVSPRGRVQICGKNGCQWMNACVCEKVACWCLFKLQYLVNCPRNLVFPVLQNAQILAGRCMPPYYTSVLMGVELHTAKCFNCKMVWTMEFFLLQKWNTFFSWYCCHVNSSFRQLRGVKIWKKWDHSKVRPWFWPKLNFHGINKVINCCQSIQNIWKSTLVIGLFCHFENFLNISISSTFDLILKVEELAGTYCT